MKSSRNICCLLLALLLASCEVEFSPNAEWQDIPVVYCLLDPDNDTVFARVERCFLGDGSIYEYGSIADSLHYPQGSIAVTLYAFRGNRVVDSADMQYTLRPREDGAFASTPQPVYYSTAPLDTTCRFSLRVRRTADDSLLAVTDTIPLVLQANATLISRPSNNHRFGFHENAGGTTVCKIQWPVLQGGRRYSPIVRFYYREFEDTLYVDLPAGEVAATTTSTTATLGYDYPRESFLHTLREYFVHIGDTVTPKYYLEYVDIFLTACDEPLNVYMMSVASGTNLTQTTDTYTNVHGGAGIFAARLTHRYKHFLADNSTVPMGASNPGLRAFLKDLGIGFQ